MSTNRLSGLDASFLQLEREGAHMHVASTTIFEGPPPEYAEFRDHIASRLHLVPRFRQKLRFVPYNLGRPVWVDDPHLNLDYHVRHTALPPPGGEVALKRLAARIFSQRLDRSKPLWEMWLVEGLERGRFAIVGKTHHCLVDGVSGVDITTVLFDTTPDPAPSPSTEEWLPSPEPSDAQLVAEAAIDRALTPLQVLRGAGAIRETPVEALAQLEEGLAAASELIDAGLAAPPSPINVDIGTHRRFQWVRAELDELKRIKNSLGGTVNDVVLSVVAGALGRYLRGRGHSTVNLELRAMVPISVRSEAEHGALGNKVSAMMAPLPVWSEDPKERLEQVVETMGDLKESKQAVGANLLTGLADFAPPTVAAQAARLQPRLRAFNLVVTNIPGPQFPLYLLGRELETVIPMVPLARRQAVCVGIMSYNGQINFGLIGDYDAMPGLESLAGDLEAAIEELSRAAPKGKRPRRARSENRAEAEARST